MYWESQNSSCETMGRPEAVEEEAGRLVGTKCHEFAEEAERKLQTGENYRN